MRKGPDCDYDKRNISVTQILSNGYPSQWRPWGFRSDDFQLNY